MQCQRIAMSYAGYRHRNMKRNYPSGSAKLNITIEQKIAKETQRTRRVTFFATLDVGIRQSTSERGSDAGHVSSSLSLSPAQMTVTATSIEEKREGDIIDIGLSPPKSN